MSSWSYFYSTQVFKQDFKTIGGTAIGDRDEVEYELKISLYLVYQYQLKQKRTEFAYTQQRNGKEYGFSCILMWKKSCQKHTHHLKHQTQEVRLM